MIGFYQYHLTTRNENLPIFLSTYIMQIVNGECPEIYLDILTAAVRNIRPQTFATWRHSHVNESYPHIRQY